jgi:hypothetical protein
MMTPDERHNSDFYPPFSFEGIYKEIDTFGLKLGKQNITPLFEGHFHKIYPFSRQNILPSLKMTPFKGILRK